MILFTSNVTVLHLFIFNNVQESGFADGKLYKNINTKTNSKLSKMFCPCSGWFKVSVLALNKE